MAKGSQMRRVMQRRAARNAVNVGENITTHVSKANKKMNQIKGQMSFKGFETITKNVTDDVIEGAADIADTLPRHLDGQTDLFSDKTNAIPDFLKKGNKDMRLPSYTLEPDSSGKGFKRSYVQGPSKPLTPEQVALDEEFLKSIKSSNQESFERAVMGPHRPLTPEQVKANQEWINKGSKELNIPDVRNRRERKRSKNQSIGSEKGTFTGTIARSTPMKVVAGASVSTLIMGNMVRSKGQQSNAELYGQRTPYM